MNRCAVHIIGLHLSAALPEVRHPGPNFLKKRAGLRVYTLYSRATIARARMHGRWDITRACGPMLSVVEAASGWRPSQHVCPVESTPHSPRESKQQALASSACLFVSTRRVFCMRQARRGHNAHQEHPSGTTTLNASRTIVDTIATLD